MKTIDNDIATNYAYDAEGTRVTKSGSSGEVTYVDPAYVIRNNSITGKHVFVGNTRVASKMDVTGVLADEEDENVEGVYYYHADHLGSSSVVTGKEGGFHERIEYFPYGETWVHNKSSEEMTGVPYKFTSKELDPETGLIYFGARYYDARLGRWVSTDAIYSQYLDGEIGYGGVYNSINNNLYHYASNNPLNFKDPDGNITFRIPFTKKYVYLQQKPRDKDGGFKGYRFGVTTKNEGRHIDPTGDRSVLGLIKKQKISYYGSSSADGPTSDRKVSFKQAKAVENVAKKSGLIFNVNSTVRNGKGQGHHSTGNAVDINRIAENGDVKQFHATKGWKSKHSVYNIWKSQNQNLVNTLVDAFKIEGTKELLHPKNRKDHYDHIHAGDIDE